MRKLKSIDLSKFFYWFLIFFGVILRLREYFLARSFWIDEAEMAADIRDGSFSGLFYGVNVTYSPLGFLWIEKIMVTLFGDGELTFRLPSLVAGILSLFFFFLVARIFLGNKGSLVALGIFAISNKLIYFSTELKHYSFDVLATVLLYWLVLSKKNWKVLILVGVVLVWFSQSVPIILVSLGINFTIYFFWKRKWRDLVRWIIIQAFWYVSLGVYYFIFAYQIAQSRKLHDFWAFYMAPITISSKSLIFYKNAFLNMLQDPLEATSPVLAAAILILGLIHLFRRKKFLFAALTLPFFITGVASSFQTYPLVGRFLVFLMPLLILLMISGLAMVGARLK